MHDIFMLIITNRPLLQFCLYFHKYNCIHFVGGVAYRCSCKFHADVVASVYFIKKWSVDTFDGFKNILYVKLFLMELIGLCNFERMNERKKKEEVCRQGYFWSTWTLNFRWKTCITKRWLNLVFDFFRSSNFGIF